MNRKKSRDPHFSVIFQIQKSVNSNVSVAFEERIIIF